MMSRMALSVFQCKQCGCDFNPRLRTRQFCSRACLFAWRAANRTLLPERACASCGVTFRPRFDGASATDRTLYCSRTCMGKAMERPLAERFWSFVAKAEGDACWEWTGFRTPDGYGRIASGGKFGTAPGAGTMYNAHRVSWQLHNGEIPDGLVVCHKCDNPACVRPDHLFVGTQKDNMQDCARKGRIVTPRKRAS